MPGNKSKEGHYGLRAVRLISIFGFFCAIPMAVGVFTYTRKAEQDEFSTQYSEFALKVLEAIGSTFENSLGAFDNLALSLVSSVHSMNQTFPNIRVNDFSIRAAKTLSLSKAKILVTCPIVREEIYDSWTNWTAQEGRTWVNEALNVLKTDRNFYGPIVEDYFTLEYIYNVEGAVPRSSRNVYLPSWQAYPIVPSWPPYNFDYITGLLYTSAHVEMLERGKVAITNPYLNPDPNDPEDVSRAELDAAWLSKRLHPDEEPLEPASDLYFPIRDNVGSIETDAELFPPVAAFAVTFYWRDHFRGILPDSAKGILVVVENPCSASFTYRLDGPAPTFLGRGDLHEAKYNGMMFESLMTDLGSYRIRMSTYTGPQMDEVHCPISFKLYPSSLTESEYTTRNPTVFSLFTILLCMFASILFLLYDRYHERRSKSILEEAKRSDDMVSSLFPESIRSRVFARQENGKRLEAMGFGDTIAELYTHTTVLFADIVGFTAWASTRDASDVFTLLESIYFQFDALARELKVFKVETIGDCYVAVCGLPEPREDHAVVMAEFCAACRRKMELVVEELVTTLGPGTENLCMRYGLNSGPTTAGVLRGDRSRFQLFGDTANVAARMEGSSLPNRIQASQKTADLLIQAGKGAWVTKRKDAVYAKGKGVMTTYWIEPDDQPTKTGILETVRSDDYLKKLIDFNTEVLENLLKDVVLSNQSAGKESKCNRNQLSVWEPELTFSESNPRDQIVELIPIPKLPNRICRESFPVKLPIHVSNQVRHFVAKIAVLHNNNNHFHNFDHATHVAMSTRKLLARILKPLQQQNGTKLEKILRSTYALTSHPMIQFAVYFSALIHDVEHPGVSNRTLSDEGDVMAEKFKHKSSAEQNSIVIAWEIFMSHGYKELRALMFPNDQKLKLFRQLVINAVMATDIFDSELKSFRERRWYKVFSRDDALIDSAIPSPTEGMDREGDLRATIVIEHIIQASDVVHTMQHWTVYQMWNQRLFAEMRKAYHEKRADKDPAENWYRGELWFFDNYIIPLAKKLKECGVFGVSCDEVLDFALDNRLEWEQKGEDIVRQWVESSPFAVNPVLASRNSLVDEEAC